MLYLDAEKILQEGMTVKLTKAYFSDCRHVGEKVTVAKTTDGWRSGDHRFEAGDELAILLNPDGTPFEGKRISMLTKLNNMMKRLLDKDTQALVKAGYINGDLELTETGKVAIWGILFDTHKSLLVESANADIAEAEEELKKNK